MVVKSEDVEHELKLMSNKKNKPYPFNKAEISRCPRCDYTGARAFHVEDEEIIYLQCGICYKVFKKFLK